MFKAVIVALFVCVAIASCDNTLPNRCQIIQCNRPLCKDNEILMRNNGHGGCCPVCFRVLSKFL